MSVPRSTSLERGLVWLVALILALGAMVPLASRMPVRAASPDLFFSEYIEGSSNNKAIEIYNGTEASVDLGAGQYAVQMHFNGAADVGLNIPLVGTVAAGDTFVLAHSGAGAAVLAVADQTNGAGWFNGDDAVVLRKDTTVLDVIGQVGLDPGTEWGAGLASTADNTLRRKATVEAFPLRDLLRALGERSGQVATGQVEAQAAREKWGCVVATVEERLLPLNGCRENESAPIRESAFRF